MKQDQLDDNPLDRLTPLPPPGQDYQADYSRWGRQMTPEDNLWRQLYFRAYGRTPLPPEAFLPGYDGYNFNPYASPVVSDHTIKPFEFRMRKQGLDPDFFTTDPL